jgi:hypothetical protein
MRNKNFKVLGAPGHENVKASFVLVNKVGGAPNGQLLQSRM